MWQRLVLFLSPKKFSGANLSSETCLRSAWLPSFTSVSCVSLPILQTTIYNSVNTRNCEFLVVLLYFDICFFFCASSFVKLAPWSCFWTVRDHTECYTFDFFLSFFFFLHQKCSSNKSSGKCLSFYSLWRLTDFIALFSIYINPKVMGGSKFQPMKCFWWT